jgi:hypothetical protein
MQTIDLTPKWMDLARVAIREVKISDLAMKDYIVYLLQDACTKLDAMNGNGETRNEHCKCCNERSEYEDRNGITDERVGDKMADIIEGALEDIKLADLDTSELQTEILGTLNEIYAPGADRYALFPYEEIAGAIGEHPKDVDNFFKEFDVKDWLKDTSQGTTS